MKNLISSTFIVSVFVLGIGLLGVGEANAQPVREILDRMDKHYKALQTLEANVSRTIFNAQLREADDYSGNVTLVPGKGRDVSMRLNWTKPRTEILSVAKGKYQLYVPDINTAYRGSTSSQKVSQSGGGALSMLSMSEAEIKSKFEISYIGQVNLGGTEVWHIRLDPRARQSFKSSEMWVDKDGMPIQVRITAHNNDTDTFKFSSIKRNNRIPGETFAVNIAKGTKIVSQ